MGYSHCHGWTGRHNPDKMIHKKWQYFVAQTGYNHLTGEWDVTWGKVYDWSTDRKLHLKKLGSKNKRSYKRGHVKRSRNYNKTIINMELKLMDETQSNLQREHEIDIMMKNDELMKAMYGYAGVQNSNILDEMEKELNEQEYIENGKKLIDAFSKQ